MRQLVTIAATILTLSALSLATPALADHNVPGGTNGNSSNGGYSQNNTSPNGSNQNDRYRGGQYDDDYGNQGQGQWNDNGRRFDRRFDFDRQEGNFDRWERGWGRHGFNESRHQRPLSYWRIVRRLEAQGYFGVRGLRQSRHGFGWRAFAFTGRGRPVMLHINPYSGRVMNVRYV